jgi:hypothetical protein
VKNKMTRRKKIVLMILSIVAVVATIFFIKMYLFFTAKPNIAVNYVAEWNKISKPENYDPNQNAFFDYQRAAEFYKSEMLIKITMYKRYRKWQNWPGDMNEAHLNIVQNLIADNNKALDYFTEGSKQPYYWVEFPEPNTMYQIIAPDLGNFRSLSMTLGLRAKLYANGNKINEAFEDILACSKASLQLTEPTKTLVEYLVGMACQGISIESANVILSNKDVNAADLENFQKKFQENAIKHPRDIDLTEEKFKTYDVFQRIFSDDGRGNGHLIPREAKEFDKSTYIRTVTYGKPQKISFMEKVKQLFTKSSQNSEDQKGPTNYYWYALWGPDRKHHKANFEKLCKLIEDSHKQNPWQLHNKKIEIEKVMKDELKNYLYISSMVQVYSRIITVQQRIKVSESALLTTLGALRFKKEKGRPPESLQELVDTGYIEQLPIDPYNNGALTYINTGDGFLLYSFGEDFDDDGGTYSEWGYRGGDQVFWPVEKDEKK